MKLVEILAGLSLAAFLSRVTALTKWTRPPHMILIMVDGLGWSDVSWTNRHVRTPALQRLVDTGVLLNQAYTLPSTAGSQYAFMTGRYPFRDGIQYTEGTAACLPHNQLLLPRLLKAQGYETHLVGRWQLKQCHEDPSSNQEGFDSFYGFHEDRSALGNIQSGVYQNDEEKGTFDGQVSNITENVARQALEVLGAADGSRPVFLLLSFPQLHHNLQVPERFIHQYDGIQNRIRKHYLGAVSYVDYIIGKLVAILYKKEIYRNSVIAFTTTVGGNPGSGASSFPLRGSGGTLYEAGVRAVTLVSGGRVRRKGCQHDGLFHVTDWFSTLLAAARGPAPGNTDGVNQWDMVVSGRDSSRHQVALNLDTFVTDTHLPLTGFAAIRYGDYKLLVGYPGLMTDVAGRPISVAPPPEMCQRTTDPDLANRCTKTNEGMNTEFSRTQDYHRTVEAGNQWQIQLFDVQGDPGESTNLVEEMPDLARLLLEKVQTYYDMERPHAYGGFKTYTDDELMDRRHCPQEGGRTLKNFQETLRNIKFKRGAQLTCTITFSKLVASWLEFPERALLAGILSSLLFCLILTIKYCAVRRNDRPKVMKDVNNNPDPPRQRPKSTSSSEGSGSCFQLPVGKKDHDDLFRNKVKGTLRSLTKRSPKRMTVGRNNSLFALGKQPIQQCCVVS